MAAWCLVVSDSIILPYVAFNYEGVVTAISAVVTAVTGVKTFWPSSLLLDRITNGALTVWPHTLNTNLFTIPDVNGHKNATILTTLPSLKIVLDRLTASWPQSQLWLWRLWEWPPLVYVQRGLIQQYYTIVITSTMVLHCVTKLLVMEQLSLNSDTSNWNSNCTTSKPISFLIVEVWFNHLANRVSANKENSMHTRIQKLKHHEHITCSACHNRRPKGENRSIATLETCDFACCLLILM